MRSDDWLSVAFPRRSQMLRGQTVMRCPSRVWDLLELSLGRDSALLWSFPVMISPRCRHPFCSVHTCGDGEWGCSEWLICVHIWKYTGWWGTQGLYMSSCLLKTLPLPEKRSAHLRSVRQVCACACIFLMFAASLHLQACARTGLFTCIHTVWEGGKKCHCKQSDNETEVHFWFCHPVLEDLKNLLFFLFSFLFFFFFYLRKGLLIVAISFRVFF